MQQQDELKRERLRLLRYLEKLLETPMVILGLLWLVLMIFELTRGLSSELMIVSYIIWGIFIFDFILKLALAPEKAAFLKRNIITIISLTVPAIRAIRLLTFARFLRTLRLAKVIGTLNRNMRSLHSLLRTRALGYVISFTVIVIIGGAAGMYALEKDQGEIKSYTESLYVTAMLVITMGSEKWPKSPEGRILAFVISVYGFTILGYVTASLATFFIGKQQNLSQNKSAKKMQQVKDELQQVKRSMNRNDPDNER